jgi:tRNA nucleotidyltransferase (CCA-adding enzyme)
VNSEEVTSEVLKRITPQPEEEKKVLALAERLKMKVSQEAEKLKLKVDAVIGGSVAKDTWLSVDVDLDIFVLFSTNYGKKELEQKGLRVAINSVEGSPWTKRFAEHPYLEAVVQGVRVNIVPCYKVERGGWISAADRSPHHTEYVRQRLKSDDLRGDIRLLKQFMKGIKAYGAEIKIGGFSGYLCEVLVLAHGSFFDVLLTAADWQQGHVVDSHGYYSRLGEAESLFDSPLIVIDPIDQNRNAAASVTEEKLGVFVAAARMFIQEPEEKFFFPEEKEPYEDSKLREVFKNRGTDIIFLCFSHVEVVPDVLWGQLYKSMRSICRLLRQYDFQIVRTSAWSDEEKMNIILIEIEENEISQSKRHLGPKASSRDSDKFLEKHINTEDTVSGPWIEKGRWVVTKKRQHLNAASLLKEELNEGGRNVGVGSKLERSVKDSLRIILNEEIIQIYSSHKALSKFLIEYLEGKPSWLV